MKSKKTMKSILGLDLGTNSIGWALVEQDFESSINCTYSYFHRIIKKLYRSRAKNFFGL